MKNEVIVDPSLSIAECKTDQPLIHERIGDQLSRTALESPDAIAIISHHENVVKTFSQLNDDATKLANFLRTELELRLGDSVAIWSGSCYNLVVTMYACTRAGLLSWLLDPKMAAEELQRIVSLSKPTALFLPGSKSRQQDVYASFQDRIKTVDGLPDTVQIAIDGDDSDGLNIDSILQSESADRVRFADTPKPEDGAYVWMTSGSTGVSKALVRDHIGPVNESHMFHQRCHFSKDDRMCLPVPLQHAFGCTLMNAIAISRCSLVLPNYRYSTKKTIEAVEKYGCTYLAAVPTMLLDLLASGQPDRLRSLRTFSTSGSPISENTLNRIFEYLPQLESYSNEYGSSELLTNIHWSPRPCSTVGTPIPWVTLKIVDAKGDIVPHGNKGNLVAKGALKMVGYHLGDRIDGSAFDKDGWYNVGDICHMDSLGNLYYVNRAKDLIRRGGKEVAPGALEEVLTSVPAVRQVFVVGVPDASLGQEVCVFVQLYTGQVATVDQLMAALQTSLPHDEMPKHWDIGHSAPPLLGNGKLDAVKLKAMMAQKFVEDSIP